MTSFHGHTPQLYLVLSVPDDTQTLFTFGKTCHDIGGVGAMLLEYEKEKEASFDPLRKVIASIQSLGIATLLAHEPTWAQTLKADGVHLSQAKDYLKQYATTREKLGSQFIIGIDAGRSRHEAMCLAEAGADYIAFGKVKKTKTSQDLDHVQRDLVAWWAELFEVPCVAMDIETPIEARKMVEAGADFIAIKLPQELSSKNVERFLSPYISVLGL